MAMLIGSSENIAGDIDIVEVVHGLTTVKVKVDSVPATDWPQIAPTTVIV